MPIRVFRLALLLIILVAVNIVAFHPRYRIRWDATDARLNSLSPESIEIAESLPASISAVGFYTNASSGRRARAIDLLQQYRLASNGTFSYELYNPDVSPQIARDFGVTEDATLLIIHGETQVRVRLLTEAELTNAIFNALNPRQRRVVFLTGHGERNLTDGTEIGLSILNSRLTQRGILTQQLNLLTGEIPNETDLVVIAGNQSDFGSAEIDKIDQFLSKGGRMLHLTDAPEAEQQWIWNAYLADEWGVLLQDDLVSDFTYSVLGSPVNPLIWSYFPHPISENLLDLSIFLRSARSIEVSQQRLVDTTVLAETSNAAVSIATNGATRETEALSGLGIVALSEHTSNGGALIAIGDSDFVSNAVLQQFPNNALLFENTANWLMGDVEAIQLTPKDSITLTHEIVTPQDQVEFIAILLGLPVLLIIGIALAVRASRKARA